MGISYRRTAMGTLRWPCGMVVWRQPRGLLPRRLEVHQYAVLDQRERLWALHPFIIPLDRCQLAPLRRTDWRGQGHERWGDVDLEGGRPSREDHRQRLVPAGIRFIAQGSVEDWVPHANVAPTNAAMAAPSY